eukprot:g33079.t1
MFMAQLYSLCLLLLGDTNPVLALSFIEVTTIHYYISTPEKSFEDSKFARSSASQAEAPKPPLQNHFSTFGHRHKRSMSFMTERNHSGRFHPYPRPCQDSGYGAKEDHQSAFPPPEPHSLPPSPHRPLPSVLSMPPPPFHSLAPVPSNSTANASNTATKNPADGEESYGTARTPHASPASTSTTTNTEKQPWLLILVGTPGSGKTSFAQKLVNEGDNWTWINLPSIIISLLTGFFFLACAGHQ